MNSYNKHEIKILILWQATESRSITLRFLNKTALFYILNAYVLRNYL